jgi:hypothetical protein
MDVKTLEPTPALYDFVLYFECASKDWKKGAKKDTITGDGSLVDMINWNSTYSYDPDDKGGKTLFGVTESTWKEFVKKYPNNGYSNDLNSMGKQGWFDQINWYWSEKSSSGKCANYACAFLVFQMAWIGFNSDAQKSLLSTLKSNADMKGYSFITTGNTYRKIADATHAYTDPMIAYDYMRKANAAYYYNISTPDRTNKKYRMGWLNRSALSYTPYGLYVPVTVDGESSGLKYESTLDEWESTAIQLAQSNASGYIKIMDWGAEPESIDKITNNPYDYVSAVDAYSPNTSTSPLTIAYTGCNGVYQLGSYADYVSTTNSQSEVLNVNTQKTFNRGDVLNTLVKGSYTPNEIKTCSELSTSDKKKGVK